MTDSDTGFVDEGVGVPRSRTLPLATRKQLLYAAVRTGSLRTDSCRWR